MTKIEQLNRKHDVMKQVLAKLAEDLGDSTDLTGREVRAYLDDAYRIIGCNPFADSRVFGEACGQEPSFENVRLYMKLVCEEFHETHGAFWDLEHAKHKGQFESRQDQLDEERRATVEIADGCIDLIKVTCGLLEALGLKGEELWKEVHRSNMSKVQPDGTVLRREDGKILKPEGYSPPDLAPIVKRQLA